MLANYRVYLITFILGAVVATAICFKFLKTEPQVIKDTQTVHDVTTITRTIKEPNGKVITEYITDTKVEEKIVTTPIKKSKKVGLSTGYDLINKKPVYTLTVGKYINDNTAINVFADTNKQIGIGIDISF